jgi:hypothetical protein
MRERECRPPVSMMAGPTGGEGRVGRSEDVKWAKRLCRVGQLGSVGVKVEDGVEDDLPTFAKAGFE